MNSSSSSISINETTICAVASTLLALGTVVALTSRDPKGKGKSSADGTATEIKRPGIVHGVAGLIGNTPLMRIESLSELTGCEILVSWRVTCCSHVTHH